MSSAADALRHIDAGCLADIFEERPGRVIHPVVQAVKIKAHAALQGGQERHRVIFSDTKNFVQSMITVQQNQLVEEKILRRGVLVQLTGYDAKEAKGKR